MNTKLLFETDYKKRTMTQAVSLALNSLLGVGLVILAWINESIFYLALGLIFLLLIIYLLMDKPEGSRSLKLFEDRLIFPVGFRLSREIQILLSEIVSVDERYIKGSSYIQIMTKGNRPLFIPEIMMEEKKYYELLFLLKKDQSFAPNTSLESRRARRKKWEKMMFWYGVTGGVLILALIQSASSKSYLFTSYFGYGVLASFCSIMVYKRFLPKVSDTLTSRESFRIYLINFCIHSVFFTYLFMAI